MIGTTEITTIAIRMVSLGSALLLADMAMSLFARYWMFFSIFTSTYCRGKRSC